MLKAPWRSLRRLAQFQHDFSTTSHWLFEGRPRLIGDESENVYVVVNELFVGTIHPKTLSGHDQDAVTTARSTSETTRISLAHASVNTIMVACDTSVYNGTKTLVAQRPQYWASARRMVRMKLQLGLYNIPVPSEENLALAGIDVNTSTAQVHSIKMSIALLGRNNSQCARMRLITS
ncbi:hypothetical protein BBO99_00009585 [Phytophthora kernoviae]|uniref:Uncharacterized protein n=1 Tax=Phytophthora kernoviae TaxID=325452 RepID=A0A3R7JAQ2_9STRA|nr:hypothetical protein BBI17_008811 [Phytophthora kernoviae]RLN73030.1 hypothetical protein BBO99_00009585 [Phytophthora kernoviae]